MEAFWSTGVVVVVGMGEYGCLPIVHESLRICMYAIVGAFWFLGESCAQSWSKELPTQRSPIFLLQWPSVAWGFPPSSPFGPQA
jgi:hypothetical protein